MKTLLGFLVGLVLTLSTGAYIAVSNQHLQVVPTIADLKKKQVASGTAVFVLGKTSFNDGMGGAVYTFDSTASDAQDMVYLNVIQSDVISVGRWKRLNVKTQQLPSGLYITNAGKKELYMTGVTNATGEITFNLTSDGTATGTALFSTIYSNSCQVVAPIPTNVANAVNSFVSALSSDMKTTKHTFYKGNAQTVGVLGISVVPFTQGPASMTANCTVVGL